MSEDQEQHGSFVSGLFVGVLFGAAGYFVTQTKEGKQLKNNFIEHWYELKDRLIAEGVLSENEPGFSDYIAALRFKIVEFLGETQAPATNKRKSTAKKKSSRKQKKFKGI